MLTLNRMKFITLLGILTIALTTRSGVADGEMAYAPVPLAKEWRLPKAPPCPSKKLWFEGEGCTMTNAAGQKIQIEEYCAATYCESEDAALAQLDKHFRRCTVRESEKLLRATDGENFDEDSESDNCLLGKGGKLLKGRDTAPVEWQMWHIAGDVYLLLNHDTRGRMGIRLYDFVFFDGKTAKSAIKFDFLPDSDKVASILSARRNPDALGNIAAMLFNHYGWRHSVSDAYIEILLRTAAMAGSAVACKNMVLFGTCSQWPQEKLAKWTVLVRLLSQKKGVQPVSGFRMRLEDWPLCLIGL